MYNPEIALQRESDLIDDQARLQEVIDRLGENHPWTQRVSLITDILACIYKKKNEIDNCFNCDRKNEIEKEIDELILIAYNALNV